MERDTKIVVLDECISKLEGSIGTQDITYLLELQDEISTTLYWFTTEVANAYKLKEDLGLEYDIALLRFKKSFDGAVNRAEIEGKLKYADMKKNAIQADYGYKLLNMKREQANAILEQTRQRISVLKKEI
jgi:hypothetical protein